MCPKGKADDALAGGGGSWAHRASFSPVAGPRDSRVVALRGHGPYGSQAVVANSRLRGMREAPAGQVFLNLPGFQGLDDLHVRLLFTRSAPLWVHHRA